MGQALNYTGIVRRRTPDTSKHKSGSHTHEGKVLASLQKLHPAENTPSSSLVKAEVNPDSALAGLLG